MVCSASSGSRPTLIVKLAWLSRSTSSTFFPAAASAAPRLWVVVVFATPPFWFAIAMTFTVLHSPYISYTTTPAGTLGAYLMCVLCVASPWGWRLSFWLGGAAMAAGGAVWIFGMRALERISEKSGIPDIISAHKLVEAPNGDLLLLSR